jgi:hypothetical protein
VTETSVFETTRSNQQVTTIFAECITMSLEDNEDRPRSPNVDQQVAVNKPLDQMGSVKNDFHKNGDERHSSHHDDNMKNIQHHTGKQFVTSEPDPAGYPPQPAAQAEEEDPVDHEEPRVVVDPVQKRIFDEQREQIMGAVPNAVKGRFGNIMYSTFGSYVGPVLILDPYNVGPGPVRDQWFRMYETVSIQKISPAFFTCRVVAHLSLIFFLLCLSKVQIKWKIIKHDKFGVLVRYIR